MPPVHCLHFFRISIVKSVSVQMELHVFQIMEMTQLHAYALSAMKENTATSQPEEVKSDICPHLFPYQLLYHFLLSYSDVVCKCYSQKYWNIFAILTP